MLYGFMKLPKIVVYSYTLFKVRFYVTILFQMKQSVICSPLLPCNFFLFEQLQNESMRNFTFTNISSKIDSFVCYLAKNDFTSLTYKPPVDMYLNFEKSSLTNWMCKNQFQI